MPNKSGHRIEITAIFEDLYFAMRQMNLYQLELAMARMEKIVNPLGALNHAQYTELRRQYQNALTTCEASLAQLRTRYDALPKKKEKETG